MESNAIQINCIIFLNYFLFIFYNMPIKRKNYIRRKRKVYRKPATKNYRRAVARIARPLNVKPRAAKQKVTYYNSFHCRPVMDSSGDSGLKQRNFSFTMNLNSLWPFDNGYNDNSTNSGKVFNPNEPINGYSTPVTDSMTTMPNTRDGANLFKQYSKCCILGTKVTLVATPVANNTDIQLGYLYAIKHSQPSSGLSNTSTIVDVQKMPYRQMAKLEGPDAPTSGFQSGRKVGARLVCKHSVRKFNGVNDILDNQQLFCSTGSNTAAHKPNESDYLTVGVVPALVGRDLQVTDFCLQIKVEQTILWTEPLENLSTGTGNYSFPWAAAIASGAITAAGMYM